MTTPLFHPSGAAPPQLKKVWFLYGLKVMCHFHPLLLHAATELGSHRSC